MKIWTMLEKLKEVQMLLYYEGIFPQSKTWDSSAYSKEELFIRSESKDKFAPF
jgi:hypothetical protein